MAKEVDRPEYQSATMHKRFFYNTNYRWRRYDDVKVGEKLGRINESDLVVKRIYPPQGYAHGKPFPFSTLHTVLQYGDSIFDTLEALPDTLILVRRRPNETFRVPVEADYV